MFWFAALVSTRLRKFTRPCSLGKGLHHEHCQNSMQAFVTQCGDVMRAVDTNVLIRLITRDDAKQTAAAEAFVSRGAWVSHIVLIETVWVLDSVFELEQTRISLAVEMLLNHQRLVLQDPDVVQAALAHYRKRSKVGFSDCMVLEVARKAGHVPLGTFDRQLSKLDGAEAL